MKISAITLICVTKYGDHIPRYFLSDEETQVKIKELAKVADPCDEDQPGYVKFIVVKTSMFEFDPTTIMVVYNGDGQVETSAAAIAPRVHPAPGL